MQTTRKMNVAAATASPPLSSSYPSSFQHQQQQQGSSSSASASASSSSLTVYQITAVAYVYNRIARVLYLVPRTMVGWYLFTATSLLVLDKMTRGLAHVTVVLTTVLIFAGFQTIRLLATPATSDAASSSSTATTSRVDKSLRANEIRLPVISLMLSVAAARFVVNPLIQFTLGDVLSTSCLSSIFFTWTSLKSLLRITVIVGLLTISVFARYIGPQSISMLCWCCILLLCWMDGSLEFPKSHLTFLLFSPFLCLLVPLLRSALVLCTSSRQLRRVLDPLHAELGVSGR
jgi:hypothetical protein